MGLTTAEVRICNPESPERRREMELTIDTGAMYTVIHKGSLKELGMKPLGRRRFTLADGRRIQRDVGGALYRIGEYEGYAPLIFGEKTDQQLLGVTALEAMGLQVDPVTKQLKPTELLLL